MKASGTSFYPHHGCGGDPALGRMNQVDPMATKYASLSPYNYAFNDPVSMNDPSGADPDPYNHTPGFWYSGGHYTYDDYIPDRGGEYFEGMKWREQGSLDGFMGYSSSVMNGGMGLGWSPGQGGIGGLIGGWNPNFAGPVAYTDNLGNQRLAFSSTLEWAARQKPMQVDYMSFENMKGWANGVWTRGNGYTTFSSMLPAIRQAGFANFVDFTIENQIRASFTASAGAGPNLYNFSTPWIATAEGERSRKVAECGLGTESDNLRILSYFLATTHKPIGDSSTKGSAWCSAFVNWCMSENRITGTGSANSQSWTNWGQKLDGPAFGAVVVMSGHVGFFVGKNDNGNAIILGGNQGEPGSVKYSTWKFSSITSWSYPHGYTPLYPPGGN